MVPYEYTTLVEALKGIPDPRKARGKRHPWELILALIALAILHGENTPYGIGAWVAAHEKALRTLLKPSRSYLPSASTLRRALLHIDIARAEEQLRRFTVAQVKRRHKGGYQGVALDGKNIRGTYKHGKPTHLLSAVYHHPAVVVAQTEVECKENEISAAPDLLAQMDLRGCVVTADALLTQQRLCRQIVEQGGHYLMEVKGNQSRLQEDIALLFEEPPWTRGEKAQEYQRFTSVDKGHGRLERRILEASTTLNDYVDWPYLGQVIRRTIIRTDLKTGETSVTVRYAITSLSPEQADAARLEQLWRGHWTIENRVHYVRDVSMGEDAGQTHTGHIPRALALFRCMVLTLLRLAGWRHIPDAFRHYRASLNHSLQLLGLLPDST
ncbi:MAG: ISAs1 family transposase [Anaerolineae bacterium]